MSAAAATLPNRSVAPLIAAAGFRGDTRFREFFSARLGIAVSIALLRDDGEAFSGGVRAPASTEIIDVTPPHVGLRRATDKNTFGVDGEATSGADPASARLARRQPRRAAAPFTLFLMRGDGD